MLRWISLWVYVSPLINRNVFIFKVPQDEKSVWWWNKTKNSSEKRKKIFPGPIQPSSQGTVCDLYHYNTGCFGKIKKIKGGGTLRKWKARFHLWSSVFCSSLALNQCFICRPILFLIPDCVDVYLTVPALWQFLNHSRTQKGRKKSGFSPRHTLSSLLSVSRPTTLFSETKPLRFSAQNLISPAMVSTEMDRSWNRHEITRKSEKQT